MLHNVTLKPVDSAAVDKTCIFLGFFSSDVFLELLVSCETHMSLHIASPRGQIKNKIATYFHLAQLHFVVVRCACVIIS